VLRAFAIVLVAAVLGAAAQVAPPPAAPAATAAPPAQDKPLKLDIYYETNCPYCQGFITKEVVPLWADPAWRALVQFHWVAFGMGSMAGSTVTCQHGPDECVGNRVQDCAKQHFGGDTDATTDFILCMEKNVANGMSSAFTTSFNECAPPGVAAQFMACARDDARSLPLVQANNQETQAAKITQVPWVSLPSVPGYNVFGPPLKDTLCAELRDKSIPQPASCSTPAPQAAVARLRRLRHLAAAGNTTEAAGNAAAAMLV